MLRGDFTLLQVTPALNVGGVESLTVAMATAVARAGAVSLVASSGGALEPTLAASGGAEFVRMPLNRRDPISIAANGLRLEKLIRGRQVSLVHARSRASAYSALWAARRTRTPIVTSYHGIYAARSPIKRWYNRIMARGDAVIVNSAFTRDHITAEHRIDAGRIAVIPEGVDVSVFDPAVVTDERVAGARAAWGGEGPVLLLAGRLTDWKGHALAIAAVALSRFKGDLRLVFLGAEGNPALAAELSHRAGKAGVNLILAPSTDDMPAALAASDVVIAPSTEAESFGRVVAEAGAMAKVVLASRLGGPAETIAEGRTGFLVPPGDPAAWTEAVDRVLAMSGEARSAMGQAARNRISSCYSMDRMCEATFDLYRRLAPA